MHPLKINPLTNEVYLELPPPHDNIIITPPRRTDADALVKIMNDPRVYKMLLDYPHPFAPAHAEAWLSYEKRACEAVLDEFTEALNTSKKDKRENGNTPSLEFLDGCPVCVLRERQDDGTDIFIGHIAMLRCRRFEFLRDEKQEEAFSLQNEEYPVGSPKIIWEIGGCVLGLSFSRGSNYPPSCRFSLSEPSRKRNNDCSDANNHT